VAVAPIKNPGFVISRDSAKTAAPTHPKLEISGVLDLFSSPQHVLSRCSKVPKSTVSPLTRPGPPGPLQQAKKSPTIHWYTCLPARKFFLIAVHSTLSNLPSGAVDSQQQSSHHPSMSSEHVSSPISTNVLLPLPPPTKLSAQAIKQYE